MHVLHLLMKQIVGLVYVIYTGSTGTIVPNFVEDGHYSESGSPAVTTFINALYSNNTLWNGQQCKIL